MSMSRPQEPTMVAQSVPLQEISSTSASSPDSPTSTQASSDITPPTAPSSPAPARPPSSNDSQRSWRDELCTTRAANLLLGVILFAFAIAAYVAQLRGNWINKEGNRLAAESNSIAHKAWEPSVWEDCQDRPFVANTSLCSSLRSPFGQGRKVQIVRPREIHPPLYLTASHSLPGSKWDPCPFPIEAMCSNVFGFMMIVLVHLLLLIYPMSARVLGRAEKVGTTNGRSVLRQDPRLSHAPEESDSLATQSTRHQLIIACNVVLTTAEVFGCVTTLTRLGLSTSSDLAYGFVLAWLITAYVFAEDCMIELRKAAFPWLDPEAQSVTVPPQVQQTLPEASPSVCTSSVEIVAKLFRNDLSMTNTQRRKGRANLS